MADVLAAVIALPAAVPPMMCAPPSAQARCSCQRAARGLNRGSIHSGDRPERILAGERHLPARSWLVEEELFKRYCGVTAPA
jgi:hypothetical protein